MVGWRTQPRKREYRRANDLDRNRLIQMGVVQFRGSLKEEAGMPDDYAEVSAISFGPFRLLPRARLLEKDGVPVHIGGRALDVLILLVGRPGEVVNKRELVEHVWTDVSVDEACLRFHVNGLRKALGDGASGARYVVNVRGAAIVLLRRLRGLPLCAARPQSTATQALIPCPLRSVG